MIQSDSELGRQRPQLDGSAWVKYWATHMSQEESVSGSSMSSSAARGLAFGAMHLLLTAALCGLQFMTGLSSFTRDASEQLELLHRVQWYWTPLAMWMWDPKDPTNYPILIALAAVWSFAVGFLMELLIRWLFSPLPVNKKEE
jgi:hypothetical protein